MTAILPVARLVDREEYVCGLMLGGRLSGDKGLSNGKLGAIIRVPGRPPPWPCLGLGTSCEALFFWPSIV
jgi:hypothetical protein